MNQKQVCFLMITSQVTIIECEFFQFQILSSISISNRNISVLEVPRVNLIMFEDLVPHLHSLLYEHTSLIHILGIIRPTNKSLDFKQVYF